MLCNLATDHVILSCSFRSLPIRQVQAQTAFPPNLHLPSTACIGTINPSMMVINEPWPFARPPPAFLCQDCIRAMPMQAASHKRLLNVGCIFFICSQYQAATVDRRCTFDTSVPRPSEHLLIVQLVCLILAALLLQLVLNILK